MKHNVTYTKQVTVSVDAETSQLAVAAVMNGEGTVTNDKVLNASAVLAPASAQVSTTVVKPAATPAATPVAAPVSTPVA